MSTLKQRKLGCLPHRHPVQSTPPSVFSLPSKVKPRRCTAGRPRGRPGRKAGLTQRLASERERKEKKRAGRSFKTLKKQAFSLLKRSEVEELAGECGFYRRTPRYIKAFDFALCCAMAAMAYPFDGLGHQPARIHRDENLPVAFCAHVPAEHLGVARRCLPVYGTNIESGNVFPQMVELRPIPAFLGGSETWR